jgi:hypothetical protein
MARAKRQVFEMSDFLPGVQKGAENLTFQAQLKQSGA